MLHRFGSILLAVASTGLAAEAPRVTFHKDVLPILQAHCQSCHRPGQAAPMSFLTYESARPWAAAMKEAVRLRKMPPWFADRQSGHFLNDRSLKQSEIDTIAAWAETGAAAGDPQDAPAPIRVAGGREVRRDHRWPQGWTIQPDIGGGRPDV